MGEIYLGNGNTKVTRRIKSYGWKGWTLESDLGKFQSDALRNCGFESGFPTENFEEIAVKSSLKIVESGIKTAVMNSEFSTAGLQQWRRRQLPEELRRMREGLWYLENEERKEKKKEFMKKTKELTQEFKILDLRRMASNRAFQIFIPPSTFDINGISTGDREEWCRGLFEFIRDRYFDGSQEYGKIDAIIEEAMGKVKLKRMDGLGIEAISLGDVAGARAAISTGTAGGKDELVGEI